jgi:HSP20 family molecular chaperone IbpA
MGAESRPERAVRVHHGEPSCQHYHRHEWQVGAWEVDVGLPAPVDPGAARATLNLGVLTVMAPLSESGSGDAEVPVTAAD